MKRYNLIILRCNRCQHEWIPRTPREPKVCPACKSPYWNIPKKEKRQTNEVN